MFEITSPLKDDEPHSILVGGGGYGGKTYLGTMAAGQYLRFPKYSCLVTRLNYSELTGQDSIWENSLNWFCDEDRLGDLACKAHEGKARIKSPFGAKIWFKAFDLEKKKQKVKSEGYDRIINDESSELHPNVLMFQYRSLRSDLNSKIPLAMVNFSNPGGPATDYLCGEYVDGNTNYYWIDWRHNPFIPRRRYSKTLDKLSYADQQYQKHGDWHYRIQSGDIFDAALIDAATLPVDLYQYIRQSFKLKELVRTWDVASTERKTSDYTASSLFEIYESGINILTKQISIRKKPGPLQEWMKIIMESDGPEVEQRIEHQPAAAGDHLDYYFEDDFKDYNCSFYPVSKNKVLRAGKLVPYINNGAYFVENNELADDEKNGTLLFLEDKRKPYLDIFKKQAVNFPNFDKLTEDDEEAKHADRIDTVSAILIKPFKYPAGMDPFKLF